MAAKFVVLSLLVASAYGSGGYSSFSYGVSDPNTGDVKDQHEKRVGDSVVGKYSLLESDGTKRVVEYAANGASGFNAVVRKEPGVAGPAAAAALAHNAALAGTAPAVHPTGHLGAGLLGHPGALAHGALNNPLGHSPLAHGGLTNPLAYPGAQSGYGSLAHPGGLAGGLAGLAHPGAYNPHGVGNIGYPGAGYANPLAGPLGARGAPAVSTYSHSIVHEVRPYGGPYAGASAYGKYGYGAANGLANPAGHGALGHGVNNLANVWPSSLASGVNSWPSSPALGANGWPSSSNYGANGWPSSPAHGANGWSAPLANGVNGWPSPVGNGVYGAHGAAPRLGW